VEVAEQGADTSLTPVICGLIGKIACTWSQFAIQKADKGRTRQTMARSQWCPHTSKSDIPHGFDFVLSAYLDDYMSSIVFIS